MIQRSLQTSVLLHGQIRTKFGSMNNVCSFQREEATGYTEDFNCQFFHEGLDSSGKNGGDKLKMFGTFN